MPYIKRPSPVIVFSNPESCTAMPMGLKMRERGFEQSSPQAMPPIFGVDDQLVDLSYTLSISIAPVRVRDNETDHTARVVFRELEESVMALEPFQIALTGFRGRLAIFGMFGISPLI